MLQFNRNFISNSSKSKLVIINMLEKPNFKAMDDSVLGEEGFIKKFNRCQITF